MNTRQQPYLLIAVATVLGAISVASLPLAAPAWTAAGTVAGLALAWRIAGTRNLPRVLKRALFLGPFILFLAAMEFFRGDGRVLMDAGVRGVDLLLKTFTAVSLGLAWGERVGALGIARSLHRVRAPAAAVATTFLATNFLSILAREWEGVRMAARARGLNHARYAHKIRQLGGSLLSVLVRSMWRGERVAMAMQARGYAGKLPPPLTLHGPVRPGEYVLPALAVAAAAIAVLARIQP